MSNCNCTMIYDFIKIGEKVHQNHLHVWPLGSFKCDVVDMIRKSIVIRTYFFINGISNFNFIWVVTDNDLIKA